MKTKEEIHLALAGLKSVYGDCLSEYNERVWAMACHRVLCWVMDYPNDFKDVFEIIQETVSEDEVREAIEEITNETTKDNPMS